MYFSEQHTGSVESSRIAKDWGSSVGFLGIAQETHAVDVSVVLEGTVCLVSNDCLHEVVELILAHVAGHSSEAGVHPESVIGTISVLIVFDGPQSILQVFGIHVWVQSISGRVQCPEGWSGTSELLTGKTLIELTSCKVLITVDLLVLTSLELLLEGLQIRLQKDG